MDNAPRDFDAITRLSRTHGTFGIYTFCVECENADLSRVRTWSRCFAPMVGLNEDPVTGSASGALGCYLAAHGMLDAAECARESGGTVARFSVLQGFAGGRGGMVQVAVERSTGGAITGVAVSGSAMLVAEGAFRLP